MFSGIRLPACLAVGAVYRVDAMEEGGEGGMVGSELRNSSGCRAW